MPTRPSLATRGRIMRAAALLFAEHGYDGASIRAIVAKADVNQAAINYHFGNKEGLYRAVLQMALQALAAGDGARSVNSDAPSPEVALRAYVERQLRPLTATDELSRYLRIFNWETVRPTPTFRRFMAEEASPYLAGVTSLVRRFLPSGISDQQAAVAALWLLGQCSIFVRNAEQLTRPPLNFKVDRAFVDSLAGTITTWAAAGLRQKI
jgi:AcrR family transcriptional regulator